MQSANGSVDATNNFRGCNTGPGTGDCDGVVEENGASTPFDPYLKLNVTARPSNIFAGGETSVITASLASSSGTTPGELTFPDVNATLTRDLGTTLDEQTVSLEGGSGSTLLTSGSTAGTATVGATLDNAAPTASLTITARPTNGTNGTNGAAGPQGPAGATGATGATGAQGLSTSSTKLKTKKAVVKSRSLRVKRKNRTLRVKVSCPRSNGLCEGQIKILRKGKVIARHNFLVRGGRSATFPVRMGKRRYKSLKKSQKVKVALFSRDTNGAASRASKTVTLKK